MSDELFLKSGHLYQSKKRRRCLILCTDGSQHVKLWCASGAEISTAVQPTPDRWVDLGCLSAALHKVCNTDNDLKD